MARKDSTKTDKKKINSNSQSYNRKKKLPAADKQKDGGNKSNCFSEPFELIFKAPTKDKKYAAVSIINPEKKKMIFKFKCNSPKNFSVHPVHGYVEASSASAVMLTAKPLLKSACAATHKITIVLAPFTADMPDTNAALCWDTKMDWAPKINSTVVVPICYELNNGERLGGYTDSEREKMQNEQNEKYELIGGRQQVKNMHEKAANVCINENVKKGTDRDQAKKDIADDAKAKEEVQAKKDIAPDAKAKEEVQAQKVIILFVKEPPKPQQSPVAGPDEVMVQGKKYRKMKVQPNWSNPAPK